MNIITLVIFFLTFATINAVDRFCMDNPRCKCASADSNETSIACDVGNGSMYIINIKSWDYLKIYCKNWKGWDNFNFTSELAGKVINSVEFQYCGLSDEISLNDIVQKFFVEKTSALTFRSFNFLHHTLRKDHFKGFSDITRLDLSGNGISYIPDNLFEDLVNVEWIDLSDNKISMAFDIFLTFLNLKGIDLSTNGLKSIHPHLFLDLKNLEFLNLMENDIRGIENITFIDLESLRDLNIRKNNILELWEDSFVDLKNLETLDISENKFAYIPYNLFKQNTKLRKLYLQTNEKYMVTLPVELFSNLTHLQEVYLSNNGFTHLPKELFWSSTSLKCINLDGNFITVFSESFFKGLGNLEELSLRHNQITYLPDTIFKGLERLKKLDLHNNYLNRISGNLLAGLIFMEELNLENNRLSYIEETALDSMIDLKVAKFSHNKLEFIRTDSLFQYNQQLEELYLSYNNIQYFLSDLPKSGYNLKILDLSHNKIDSISLDYLLIPTYKIEIDLRYNRIKNILLRSTKNLEDYFSFRRETVVHLDYNPLLCDCQLYDLLRLIENKLPHLNNDFFKITVGDLACIQQNGTEGPLIRKLDSSTYSCQELNYFDIEMNCPINCSCTLRPADGTKIIDCSNQNLNTFFLNKTMININRNHSIIFNLAGNSLTEIPSFEYLQPINITGLLLSNNHISKVTLNRIPESLKILELDHNRITGLNLDVVQYLDSDSLKEFTFRGNPLKCDCYTHDFYRFVLSKRHYYNDLNHLKCKNFDTLIYLVPISEMKCGQEILWIILTIGGVAIVTIVILFFFFYGKNLISWRRQDGQELTVHYTARETE